MIMEAIYRFTDSLQVVGVCSLFIVQLFADIFHVQIGDRLNSGTLAGRRTVVGRCSGGVLLKRITVFDQIDRIQRMSEWVVDQRMDEGVEHEDHRTDCNWSDYEDRLWWSDAETCRRRELAVSLIVRSSQFRWHRQLDSG